MAISSVPLLLLALLYPLLPESPYWLLAMGRTQEVHALLTRIARMNGRDLPQGRLQPAAAHKAKVRPFGPGVSHMAPESFSLASLGVRGRPEQVKSQETMQMLSDCSCGHGACQSVCILS